MITFLEYSYNLEQVSSILSHMAQDVKANPGDQMKWLMSSIPDDFMDKLPDGARASAALVFKRILIDKITSWDNIGRFVQPLWDQPVAGPSKTLGRELLNRVSAKIMDRMNVDFFISYSGNLARSALHTYTKRYPRLFISSSNYRWGPYQKVLNTLQGDYTEHFNNHSHSRLKK